MARTRPALKEGGIMPNEIRAVASAAQGADVDSALLRERVSRLREARTPLRAAWTRRITVARLLSVITSDEIFSEVTAVYDNYVDALESGSIESLQAYARNLSERIIP